MFKGEANREALESKSPLFLADRINTPVLLIHGERDLRVPFNQSDDLYDELKSLEKPVRLVELEDESHYLEAQATRTEALTEAIEFVNQNIGN